MTPSFDPIATSQLITSTYRRYLQSLMPLREPRLRTALARQIATTPLLDKGPLLEATPAYTGGATVGQLITEGVLPSGLARLAATAMPMDRPLYQHQEEAIRKVVNGRNVVVATGTGSGKTEAFLLPILSSLIREYDGGGLRPGVRALLLYPMNALANDQMKRLRLLLAATPEITFGRYTGDTLESPARAAELFGDLNPGEPRLQNS